MASNLKRIMRSFRLIRSTTTPSATTTPLMDDDGESFDRDLMDTIVMYNKLVEANESVNTGLQLTFVLILSTIGIIFNLLTFIICLLMLRSLFRNHRNNQQHDSSGSNKVEPMGSPAPKLHNLEVAPLRTLSTPASPDLSIKRLSVPTAKHAIKTATPVTVKVANKFDKRRLGGKSRLMECYLLEIIAFDLMMVVYIFADNFYHFYNKYLQNNVHAHDSLEDISNFSCKGLTYVHKVASLMSCWLIVCFSLNRLCLLISNRYTYLPFLLINTHNDVHSIDPTVQADAAANIAMAEDDEITKATVSMLQNRSFDRNRSNRSTTSTIQSRYSSRATAAAAVKRTTTITSRASTTSSYFSMNTNTFGNFKLVINSKKSTVILFLLFALINIYFIEIAGLVDGEMPATFPILNSTKFQNFTIHHTKKTCGPNILDNKSVMILNVAIHQIFGLLIPYLISVFTIYYLIKNLYKIKTKINEIITRKSQPLFIRSNELIFYRTALTSIVLSIFYLITTLPYSVGDIIRIFRPSHLGLLVYLDHFRQLNFSFKFFLIYFTNSRFRRKANFIFSKLNICKHVYNLAKNNKQFYSQHPQRDNSYYNLNFKRNNSNQCLNDNNSNDHHASASQIEQQQFSGSSSEKAAASSNLKASLSNSNLSTTATTTNNNNRRPSRRERTLTLTILDSNSLMTSIQRVNSGCSIGTPSDSISNGGGPNTKADSQQHLVPLVKSQSSSLKEKSPKAADCNNYFDSPLSKKYVPPSTAYQHSLKRYNNRSRASEYERRDLDECRL